MRDRLGHVFGLGAALLLSATVSAAQPPEAPGGQGHPGRNHDRVARYLDLSEQQQAQLRQLFEKQQPQLKALHERLRENGQQMREALDSPNPDPAGVGELAIQGHRLREEARQRREAADKVFRALLTPAQQVKFDAMKELMGNRGAGPGRDGHGFGGPGFGPPPPEPPSPELPPQE